VVAGSCHGSAMTAVSNHKHTSNQLSWLSHDSCRQLQTYVKPEAAITVFELLMMSGVLLEAC